MSEEEVKVISVIYNKDTKALKFKTRNLKTGTKTEWYIRTNDMSLVRKYKSEARRGATFKFIKSKKYE